MDSLSTVQDTAGEAEESASLAPAAPAMAATTIPLWGAGATASHSEPDASVVAHMPNTPHTLLWQQLPPTPVVNASTGYAPAGYAPPAEYSGQSGWVASPPPTSLTPPVLPDGAHGRKPRRRWLSMLLALTIVAAFLAGIGGVYVGTRSVAQTSATTNTHSTTANTATTTASGSTQNVQQSVEQVISSVQSSVVEVTSQGATGEAIGSGDIVRQDGYIVTNDHVVQGYSSFTVTLSNGTSEQAQLVGQDPQEDLAVLKISASNLHPISFANSSSVQVGEFAIAVGSPLGLQQSATLGIVSAVNRTVSEAPNGPAGTLTGMVQTSAPINPGNSGGALVDLQGQLIGIPTLGAEDAQTGTTANGVGFAIPASQVKAVVSQLIAG